MRRVRPGSCPGSWSLDGNAGNPGGSYLGTTDTSLVLKAMNQRILLSDLAAGGSVPRWIGGGSANTSNGGVGAFIGGGGSTTATGQNVVGKFCVVVGGDTNNASGVQNDIAGGPTGYAAIGGGEGNTASGYVSTVAGGGGTDDDGSGHQVPAYNTASARGASVGGGQANSATGTWSTVSGGEYNTASGSIAAVAGGFLNSASGTASFVPGGIQNIASGSESFAGGYYAQAGNPGSFVWSDISSSNRFATTGSNQFLVRAHGGVGINGTPKNADIELSLYPNSASPNYSNLFFGVANTTAGILTSVGDVDSNGGARFYVDQYNGTSQLRRLVADSDGLSINGANAIDPANHHELTIYSGPHQLSNEISMNLVPGTGSGGSFGTEIYTFPNNGSVGEYSIRYYDTNGVQHSLLSAVSTNGLDHITIDGDAFKPGGGAWSSTSDRRIKQDITPIASAIDTLLRLRPVSFRYTPEYRALEGGLPDRSYLGFIAQEFAEIFPDAVSSTGKKLAGADPDAPILALDSTPALITVVAAAQELAVQAQDRDAQIARLTMANAELQSRIAGLAARLEAIEAKGNRR